MDDKNFISYFNCTIVRYAKTHASCSQLTFDKPCIGYVKKGSAQFLYKGKNYNADVGDLIYIAKNTKYSSVWSGDPEIEFYSINFDYVNSYGFFEYRFQIVKNYPPEKFDEMYRYYKTDYFLSLSYMYQILSDIYKIMNLDNNLPDKEIVQPAVEYLEKNYASPIFVDRLAKLCHSSVSGFYKQFKTATGVSPIKYKHNIMIQNALSLLTHTDMSVEEVSRTVGFTSSNYFRKVFSDITGKIPKEVRKCRNREIPIREKT